MSIRCDFTAEDVVFLIKRNWFWDINDLHDLMWQLPEEVFQKVSARKHEFHPEIQYFFNDYYYHPSIKEYTDAQWNADQRDIEDKRDKEVREFRKRFVAPPRPRNEIDDIYDHWSKKLEYRKKCLEEAISSATKKRGYIAPSKRTAEIYDSDPLVKEARKNLLLPENELERLKKTVESLDKTWTEEKFVDAMILNAGRLSEA